MRVGDLAPGAPQYRTVWLEPEQALVPGIPGLFRRTNVLYMGKGRHSRRRPQDRYQQDSYASVGEYVASLALDVSWPMVWHRSDGAAGDIGGSPHYTLQVRHTLQHHHRLPVKKSDTDAHILVLVTGDFPEFRVHGWLRAGMGKQPRWWRDRRSGWADPAWAIPQGELNWGAWIGLPPIGERPQLCPYCHGTGRREAA